MSTVIRHVGELDAADRSVMERVVGQPLRVDEQIVIQIEPDSLNDAENHLLSS